jgi:hypothetical protein
MQKDVTKNSSTAKGSDWTRLLTDPDLVSHLGKLLQTYREVPHEKREQALLQAMREIKESAVKARAAAAASGSAAHATTVAAPQPERVPEPVLQAPEPVQEIPPFEPDLFTPSTGADRRRFPRIKCYVAVELRVEGVDGPVWGNLSNASRGGVLVETAASIPPGKSVEIGLWVASGKIWVKGVILNGVVTRSAPSFGVRVKFSEAELLEKEHLREFLKFVESTTKQGRSGNAYIAQLKR